MFDLTWLSLVVVVFASAGVGRLIAVDTILHAPRSWILARTSNETVRDGLTCPSCIAFWATIVARLIVHGYDWSLLWWTVTFACWGAAAVVTRKGG